jgi:hypothetical protein
MPVPAAFQLGFLPVIHQQQNHQQQDQQQLQDQRFWCRSWTSRLPKEQFIAEHFAEKSWLYDMWESPIPHLFTQQELVDADEMRNNWRSVVSTWKTEQKWAAFMKNVQHAMGVVNYNVIVAEVKALINSWLVNKDMDDLVEARNMVMGDVVEVAKARNKVVDNLAQVAPRYSKRQKMIR